MKLQEKIIISGTLTLLSGLHIGDSKENVEIGGVDSPVVRRKDNNQPYIPGSSLKGKLRSLLEIAYGANADSKFEDYSDNSVIIAKLFGWFGKKKEGKDGNPARLIVRDAKLTPKSAEKLGDSDFTDLPYTEVKSENSINRLKGTAEAPRFIERVPAGAEFDVEFVINIMEDSNKEAFLSLLKSGIALLENDYLGGSGSRGYGQVKFELKEPVSKTAEAYLNPGN